MKQTLSVLHPNPGWNSSSKDPHLIGKHCILELYECNSVKLNDEDFIRSMLSSGARVAGAQLLSLITHSFCPQGVTGLALLSESHISIHTWPESRYAAIDVFTCGEHTDPEKSCELFVKAFEANKHHLKSISRNTPMQLINKKRFPSSR